MTMHTPQHSITHINQCRNLAQQLIQQTQQANHQYQQMLQNEQQNAQVLEQMIQKERMAVQTIQQSLQGHELAIQRCQEVIAQCNQLERELTGQMGSVQFQPQTFVNPSYQAQPFQNYQNPTFNQ
jgi:multidrug resistance efflux pump